MRAIPVHEMYHLALVANIMVAVGGMPRIYTDNADVGFLNFPIENFFGQREGDDRHYRFVCITYRYLFFLWMLKFKLSISNFMSKN